MSADVLATRTPAAGWRLAAGAMLATIVVYVTAFLFGNYRDAFHSDAALKSVLADAAVREHALFPHAWTYANGDLLTTTPYAISRVLVPFLGVGFQANVLATWLGYIAALVAAWWLSRKLMPGRAGFQLAAVGIVACAPGALHLEFFVGQGAYSVYAALALPMFGLLCVGARRRRASVAVALLAFLLASSNPTRAAVMCILPVLCALPFAALVRERALRPGLRALVEPGVLAMLLGAIVGTLMYRFFWLPSVDNFDAAARVTLATPAHMLAVARMLPADWFGYFTLHGAWDSLGAGARVVQAIAWCLAALLPLSPFALLRDRDEGVVRYGWLCLALFASGLAPLVLLDGLYQGSMEIRYCTLALLCSSIALPLALSRRAPATSSSTALGIVLAGCVVVAMSWLSPSQPGNPDARGVSRVDHEALLDALARHRIGTAMATYWHSHVLTVMSAGAVYAHPVGLGDRLSPFPHHSPHRPAHGTAGPRQAVVLTRGELGGDGAQRLARQLGAPSETFEAGPFVVLAYDRDVAAEVFGVGHRFDAVVPPAEVAIDTGTDAVPACAARNACVVRLHLRNTGHLTLATAGRLPMRIGLRGLDSQGAVVAPDLGRIEFPVPLSPGQHAWAQATLGALPATIASIEPCLLQENAQWLCDRTTPRRHEFEVDAPVAADRLGLALTRTQLAPCGLACTVDVDAFNTGATILSSSGDKPLRLGIQALGADGALVENDAGRVDFPHPIPPGGHLVLRVAVPATPGAARYRVCLLQEGVAWHCERTTTR